MEVRKSGAGPMDGDDADSSVILSRADSETFDMNVQRLREIEHQSLTATAHKAYQALQDATEGRSICGQAIGRARDRELL